MGLVQQHSCYIIDQVCFSSGVKQCVARLDQP
eukprot:SAG31_NODE_28202_length_414_cov_0.657143_1_plen_31_part_01